MILCIANVIPAADLVRIDTLLANVPFVDGAATAGWHARLVKRNEQAQGNAAARQAGEIVIAALRANETFHAAVLPQTLRPILFSRYGIDMSYGTHVDNAIMADADLVRSDVSITVFLSGPNDYEGGELVIESTGGERSYKLDAGSVIIYPSTTLHRVEPVTRGARLVGVSWIQSMVRSAEDREILYDLDDVRRALFRQGGKSRDFDLLTKSYTNLLRKWAEP
jgi:PKHD-type hydroxylase